MGKKKMFGFDLLARILINPRSDKAETLNCGKLILQCSLGEKAVSGGFSGEPRVQRLPGQLWELLEVKRPGDWIRGAQ